MAYLTLEQKNNVTIMGCESNFLFRYFECSDEINNKEQTGTNNDEIGNICGFQNVNRDT